MNILIYRPLVFALIEYCLSFYIFKRGIRYKNFLAAILFFLATYQLGEFIFFSQDSYFGIQMSYASTTMLPALGIGWIEKHTKQKWGFPAFMIIAFSYALFFLSGTGFIKNVGEEMCFVKFVAHKENFGAIMYLWSVYYLGTLFLSVLILGYTLALKNQPKYTWQAFVAYLMFFPSSIILIWLFGLNITILASLMCSLAVFAAMIMAYVATDKDQSIKIKD